MVVVVALGKEYDPASSSLVVRSRPYSAFLGATEDVPWFNDVCCRARPVVVQLDVDVSDASTATAAHGLED